MDGGTGLMFALVGYGKDITMTLSMNRRHALRSVPVLAVAGHSMLVRQHATARETAIPVTGTPAATPVIDDPEAILDLLLETPVKTPLFPSDTGKARANPWVDEGDTDLIGTVGGVLMQTGQDFNRNFIGPGVYIVFPSAEAARARLDDFMAEAGDDFEGVDTQVVSIELAGYPGMTVREPDSTYTIVVAGPVIASGLADSDQPGDPALRSLVNCLALLDHLQSVTS